MNQEQGIKKIAEAVKESGGRAMLVGGFVRDFLRGEKPKDADIECFNIEPSVLKQVLEQVASQHNGSVDCVGASFQVFKVAFKDGEDRVEFDISIPRSDKKVGDGHKGFEVVGNPNASFEEAARRRDFKFNAIMMDALTGEIIDPFNGREDLKDNRLTVVDPKHFGEDSLRVLRGIQFASRFQLSAVDGPSWDLMRTISLKDLPKERIWGEFEKIILKSKQPSFGFVWAFDFGVFEQLFPPLHHLLDPMPQRNEERREKFINWIDGVADCFEWDKKNSANPKTDAEKIAVMLGVVARFLQEPESLLDFFGIFNIGGLDVRGQAIAIAKNLQGQSIWNMSDADLRRMALQVNVKLFEMALAAKMDGDSAEFFTRCEELGIWDNPPKNFLQGKDLIAMGIKPGPQMGNILKEIFEAQLDGKISSIEEAREMAKAIA
jgi:tRNA nucleotidyltransferase (CCA-adding enzyme)